MSKVQQQCILDNLRSLLDAIKSSIDYLTEVIDQEAKPEEETKSEPFQDDIFIDASNADAYWLIVNRENVAEIPHEFVDTLRRIIAERTASKKLYELLKRLEWIEGDGTLEIYCQICGCRMKDGHYEKCELAAVLAGKEKKQ